MNQYWIFLKSCWYFVMAELDMDQGLDMDAYWKHDLSILWTVTQRTEQCRLRSNDLYMGNNRSSSLIFS
ncbi:uncharacterized protein LOC103828209 isoform X2 [Brassica rapa]|uniref:uncharacterized protein LOC103828209 isoform X2 n=1 Tax=Brassica campestris TaxID=3711 RepID=UPI00142DB68B|nr:uncharacterized protein LOC103828209 isoform X2 [Brassica rapa]